MAEVVYSTVQIAPYPEEVTISGNTVSTEFAGGIKYTAEGLEHFKEEVVKSAFSVAIAVASKRWELEEMLNEYFRLDGKVE